MQGVAKGIHRTVFYACFVGMVVVLLMMLLTTFDVIGRAFFTRPITGAFEITQYMLVIIVLFGIGYAQQTGRHVRVELFADKLPPRGQLALDSFFTFMAFGFFSLVAWQGWEGGFHALHVKTASDILRVPSYPFEFIIAVGAFLISLELLLKLVTSVKNLRGGIAGKEMTG